VTSHVMCPVLVHLKINLYCKCTIFRGGFLSEPLVQTHSHWWFHTKTAFDGCSIKTSSANALFSFLMNGACVCMERERKIGLVIWIFFISC
jgi:hypothetical protein